MKQNISALCFSSIIPFTLASCHIDEPRTLPENNDVVRQRCADERLVYLEGRGKIIKVSGVLNFSTVIFDNASSTRSDIQSDASEGRPIYVPYEILRRFRQQKIYGKSISIHLCVKRGDLFSTSKGTVFSLDNSLVAQYIGLR